MLGSWGLMASAVSKWINSRIGSPMVVAFHLSSISNRVEALPFQVEEVSIKGSLAQDEAAHPAAHTAWADLEVAQIRSGVGQDQAGSSVGACQALSQTQSTPYLILQNFKISNMSHAHRPPDSCFLTSQAMSAITQAARAFADAGLGKQCLQSSTSPLPSTRGR